MSFQNDVSNALLNMYDVRNMLEGMITKSDVDYETDIKVLDVPKDNDGTSTTISDCIHDVIEMLESYDNGGSSTW